MNGTVIGKWALFSHAKIKTMKKLLTACIVLASALAIHASASDNTKALCDKMNAGVSIYTDTVPSDTSKKDSLIYGTFVYNVNDTVPADTSKKDTMFASAVAYRVVNDTVPTDTTRKDTTFAMLAFNR